MPDDVARMPVEKYVNPRKAEWPQADFILGNPPFIGNKRMREALGDGYVEALRRVWTDVPETSDFVMYWWSHAAEQVRYGKAHRFGLITTNSLRQTFSRKVIEYHMAAKPPLVLSYAIPDHPWVDSTDGAAVRIAMTVGATGEITGRLAQEVAERTIAEGEQEVTLSERSGEIHANLTVGAGVSKAAPLRANEGVCFQGMNLVGKGFRLRPQDVTALGYDLKRLPAEIKPHFNARGLMQDGEPCFIIDLFGMTADEARHRHSALYQWLFDRVKPERDHNNRASYREKWWVFGEPRGKLRAASGSLRRIILTPETAKHRIVTFVDLPFCPDHKLYAVCSDDAYVLGVLSSGPHVTWALAAGGRMGVGNDPVYNNTRCFVTFPFPAATVDQKTHVRNLAEQFDAHRKRQQAQHADLTLTGMYNVLEKLRSGESLSAKEKVIHEQGLVAVLKTLHDDLDRAVLDAYGWSDLAPLLEVVNGISGPDVSGMPATRDDCKRALDDALLERLVALNAERAAEEQRDLIRWLRPEFQIPASGQPQTRAAEQLEIDTGEKFAVPAKPGERRPWPATLPAQVRAVAEVLTAARAPLADDAIAARFTGRGAWKKRLPQIIDTLVAVGRVRRRKDGLAVIA